MSGLGWCSIALAINDLKQRIKSEGDTNLGGKARRKVADESSPYEKTLKRWTLKLPPAGCINQLFVYSYVRSFDRSFPPSFLHSVFTFQFWAVFLSHTYEHIHFFKLLTIQTNRYNTPCYNCALIYTISSHACIFITIMYVLNFTKPFLFYFHAIVNAMTRSCVCIVSIKTYIQFCVVQYEDKLRSLCSNGEKRDVSMYTCILSARYIEWISGASVLIA